MKNIENDVSNEVNLNTLAKSIYIESLEMGFKSGDYVKLMNELLDMTISGKKIEIPNESISSESREYKSNLPIKTKHLIIRTYNPELDRKLVAKWFKDENNRLFSLSTTSKNHLDLENLITDNKNIFATITLSNNKPIGLLAILNVDKENRKGEMRKLIGEMSERGKGYAKEATQSWLKYCVGYLGLNKIYINTIEANFKNITLNRQLGFKIEGLLKKECIINNVEHDVLRMAYFREV